MNEHEADIPATPGRTESQHDIETLRRRGGLFVDAVRDTRMPIIVTDTSLPGNPIVFANQAFEELSGYGQQELLGQEATFMGGVGTDPEVVDLWKSKVEQGDHASVELLQYRKDGSRIWTLLFATPQRDNDGCVTGHFLSFLDITRRREAEDRAATMSAELEARVADRTRDLDVANVRLTRLLAERESLLVEVNHRAKNSLSMAGAIMIIQAHRHPDPAIRALFEQAEARLASMARVHDLLSRSDNGQLVDLAVYIENLCQAMREAAGTSDRVFLKVVSEKGIFVPPDTALPLAIILNELVTNAMKHAFPAPFGGTVTIGSRRAGPEAGELMISDDGPGMARARDGGLGMSLVRAMVEKIEGRLDFLGEDGVTATVSFHLPLASAMPAYA